MRWSPVAVISSVVFKVFSPLLWKSTPYSGTVCLQFVLQNDQLLIYECMFKFKLNNASRLQTHQRFPTALKIQPKLLSRACETPHDLSPVPSESSLLSLSLSLTVHWPCCSWGPLSSCLEPQGLCLAHALLLEGLRVQFSAPKLFLEKPFSTNHPIESSSHRPLKASAITGRAFFFVCVILVIS